MTADEFVQQYAAIAPTIDTYVAHGVSDEYAKKLRRRYFVEKRTDVPDIDIPFQDETINLIKNYSVDRYFEIAHHLTFHPCNKFVEPYDFLCLINRAIPIGSCPNYWCAVNIETGEIELMSMHDLSQTPFVNTNGVKVAKNGASFFDAIIKFTVMYDEVILSKLKRYGWTFNQEEISTINKEIPEIIRLAGGETYKFYWLEFLLNDFL